MTLQQTLEDLKPLLAKYKPFEIYSQDNKFIGLKWTSTSPDEPYIMINPEEVTFTYVGQCPHCGNECSEVSERVKVGGCYELPEEWHEWMKDNDYLLEEEG